MAVERSGAVLAAQLLPQQQQDGQLPKLAVGQLLRLLVDRADADGVLVRLGDGQRLRLLGMERAPAPGAVLLLRVLNTAPRLELVWLQTGAVSAPTAAKLAAMPDLKPSLVPNTESESAAMRPNQALLHQQVATSIQDAATLALSWRAMVLAQLHQHALLRTQADGQHVPGSLFGSDAGAALLREMSHVRLAPGLEQSWLFSAYVWAGRRLLLSLVASEEEPPRPTRRRRESMALRLELMLPGLGLVKLQLRPKAGGIALDLAAEHAPALIFLRHRVRAMAAALARAELRLVRCRLGPALPAAGGALDVALAASSASGPMVSPALFRAAAELALLLSNPPSNSLPQESVDAVTRSIANEAANPAYPVWTSADGADDADFALFGDFVIR